jgi:hypothetical protein
MLDEPSAHHTLKYLDCWFVGARFDLDWNLASDDRYFTCRMRIWSKSETFEQDKLIELMLWSQVMDEDFLVIEI